MSKIDRLRVVADQSGGCEIRTREGLPPTRFPSVRPRPLGESSAGQLTGATDARERPQLRTRPARLTCRPLARRLSRQIPQGRKAARVRELWWVCGGSLPVLARITSWQATSPVPPPRTRLAPAARQLPLRWRFTAGTAQRRSLRFAARSTSQNLCDRRSATAGLTTPTCSAAPGAAEKPPAPGSWPAR